MCLALSAALVQGLVVVGLLAELEGLESMGAGRGRAIGCGEADQSSASGHKGSMTGVQLQTQVGRDGFTECLPAQEQIEQ